MFVMFLNVLTFESVLSTGESTQLKPANVMLGYGELSSLSEQSASFSMDRKCLSNTVPHSLADIKQISAKLTAVPDASRSVNSATLVNSAESNNSISMATCTSDAASFAVPLPVISQHHTKATRAADSSVLASNLPAHSAKHCVVAAQTGQPIMEVASCSSRPVLPIHTVPFKVTF